MADSICRTCCFQAEIGTYILEYRVLFAYGKGYIKQLNDSLYEQRVSYRITAPQLDSICNNEIKSISIHMGKMGYKSKMRKGVSEDLQIRYNMLMDYLLENSSE